MRFGASWTSPRASLSALFRWSRIEDWLGPPVSTRQSRPRSLDAVLGKVRHSSSDPTSFAPVSALSRLSGHDRTRSVGAKGTGVTAATVMTETKSRVPNRGPFDSTTGYRALIRPDGSNGCSRTFRRRPQGP